MKLNKEYMVGAKMDKVYLVRLRKLRGRALALFRFRAKPDKLYPSRYQPYILFIPFSTRKKNISTHCFNSICKQPVRPLFTA